MHLSLCLGLLASLPFPHLLHLCRLRSLHYQFTQSSDHITSTADTHHTYQIDLSVCPFTGLVTNNLHGARTRWDRKELLNSCPFPTRGLYPLYLCWRSDDTNSCCCCYCCAACRPCRVVSWSLLLRDTWDWFLLRSYLRSRLLVVPTQGQGNKRGCWTCK